MKTKLLFLGICFIGISCGESEAIKNAKIHAENYGKKFCECEAKTGEEKDSCLEDLSQLIKFIETAYEEAEGNGDDVDALKEDVKKIAEEGMSKCK